MTKAFSELLIEEKGCVVNIGSGAGLVYWPWTGLFPDSLSRPSMAWLRDSNTGVYASFKAAINLVSETMPLELGLLHVRVVTVVTGFVSSNFHAYRPYQLPP